MNTPAGAPSARTLQTMHAASAQLQAGNFAQARALLEDVVRNEPRFVEAHRLLGGALQALGDLAAAERSLRTAVALNPRWAPAQVALGELLAGRGRIEEAERALRSAFAESGNYPRAAFSLAQLLNRTGRAHEALPLLAPSAAAANADWQVLSEFGNALAMLQRHDEAIAAYRRAAQSAPPNGVLDYYIAAALENAGRHGEACAAAERARTRGFDAPQVWFVLGCAHLGADHFDAAEAAFREAIRRDPGYLDAQRELAQLVWMRSADIVAATAQLDAALQSDPTSQTLRCAKAALLASAGDSAGASAVIETVAQRADANAATLLVAADVTTAVDAGAAVAYAQRAARLAPNHPPIERTLGTALLAAGHAQLAAQLAEQTLRVRPDDQHMLAVQATAWRLLGDVRYRALYDYERCVRVAAIDVPAGWPDLNSYLAELAVSLRRLHGLRTHPIGQSLRHGTQTTQNLLQSDDPAIRAFVSAIDGPIRRYMTSLGNGDDPLRLRNSGKYQLKGIWSVQLHPNGYHTNHTHPEGWLSSACYIDVPTTVDQGHEGWLKLGEPGMQTEPPLPPEHFVKPEPGLLVLFPSYMWHGTVPFSGEQTRLSIAFDVVPA